MDAREDLVLLPGSLCDSWLWSAQVTVLSAEYRITTPELRGYDNLATMAEIVLADAPERFSLAGFSMGARVALEIYRRAPERVTRLAFLDSGIHPIRPGEAERRQGMIDVAHRQGMAEVARLWLPRTLHPARLSDARLVADLTAMIARFTAEDYEDEIHALLERPDAREVVPMLRCPVLVLAGDGDPLSPPEQNKAIAAQIRGAEIVIIPECGHWVPVEAPEATTAALRRWLSRPI